MATSSRLIFGKWLCFESFGVRIRIESNSDTALNKAEAVARKALVDQLRFIENKNIGHTFGLYLDGDSCSLYQDGIKLSDSQFGPPLVKFLNTLIRLTVAEFAEKKVFIHSGVVGWKGMAILLPGGSFQGKTTLVAALVKKGASYYSDEYALLDKKGMAHPFPRMLSVRGIEGKYEHTDVPIETFGKKGVRPLPVGWVIFTEYKPRARWKPELLTPGEGVMEIVPHTIPIRVNTKFALGVLKLITTRAIIAKSPRSDVNASAKKLLQFVEKTLDFGLN